VAAAAARVALDCFASAFALRASADLKPAVARSELREGGPLGIGAPNKTPTEIIGKLNSEINAGLTDPNIKSRLAELGGLPIPMTPAEFVKLIAVETEKWAKVVKFAGMKSD
jgi:hypothetical protein